MRSTKPRTPPKGCTQARTWRNFYARMATWFQDHADSLRDAYPDAAASAQLRADSYRSGAAEIDAGTHPKVTKGEWT